MQEEVLGFSIFYNNNTTEGFFFNIIKEDTPQPEWNYLLDAWNKLPERYEYFKQGSNQEEVKGWFLEALTNLSEELNKEIEKLRNVDEIAYALELIYLAEKLGYIKSDEFNGIVCYTPSYIEWQRKLRNGGQWN